MSMTPPPPPPPPPPGGQPPPPPGYQPYGVGQQMEHPQGTTILVLGILSLVICGVLGPFAWSMGNKALREIDSNPSVRYSNRGNVSAGRICGMIASILLVLGIGLFILVAIAGGFAANS